MRNFLLIVFATFALALAGCRTTPPASASPAPYTRVAHPDTNIVQLQIAVRKFVPTHHRGPAIWLAGTMHVGEPQYYSELQKFLDARTVVLFEGINTDSHPRHVGMEPSPEESGARHPQNGSAAKSSMQAELAHSLGLVFQLNAIDYDRTNFLNSDLSVEQLQRLMVGNVAASHGTNGNTTQARSNPTFDTLLQIMDGNSFLGSLVKLGLQFLGSDPKLQALAKLTLIEMVGGMKGDITGLRNVPPDLKQLLQVLIEARNQNVINDIQTELKTMPRSGSIAVFYGTGHMDDMQKRLTTELHYRPAEDIWLPAFSVDLKKSNVTPDEIEAVHNLIKWQLDQMQ